MEASCQPHTFATLPPPSPPPERTRQAVWKVLEREHFPDTAGLRTLDSPDCSLVNTSTELPRLLLNLSSVSKFPFTHLFTEFISENIQWRIKLLNDAQLFPSV
jgi:hypothetical protein